MSIFDLLKNVFAPREQSTAKKLDVIVSKEPTKDEALYDYGISAGELSKKYETGRTGAEAVGFISNGASWDPGGTSYGSYQLETNKGTMQAYLKINDVYANTLRKYKVNSQEFQNAWRELAKSDPQGFERSQFDYLAHKPGGHYDALAYAGKLGWDINNLAMQSAIFSTVNQSGGWKNGIFAKAGIVSTDSLEIQINKLYVARAAYFKSLPTGGKGQMSRSTQVNIIKNRTINERKDCLKLIK